MNKQNKYFIRCKIAFKNTGWRYILAAISAFSLIYLIKYLLSFFVSEYMSWGGAFVGIGSIGYIYNDLCQAKGHDVKNALLLDWVDIPIVTHIIIILSVPLSILLLNFVLSLLEKNDEDIKNIKHIAYGR